MLGTSLGVSTKTTQIFRQKSCVAPEIRHKPFLRVKITIRHKLQVLTWIKTLRKTYGKVLKSIFQIYPFKPRQIIYSGADPPPKIPARCLAVLKITSGAVTQSPQRTSDQSPELLTRAEILKMFMLSMIPSNVLL